MYPGLSPDPDAVRILDCVTVDTAAYEDIVWRVTNGSLDPIDVNRREGASFHPERTALDRESGRHSIVGRFVLCTEMGDGPTPDIDHPARIEATDLHWLHAAWRRARRQPPAVVMTVWKEVDTPPSS
jgi:hypothetical protein